MQQGITFDAGGPDADGPVRDRPFPLDLVPRIIPAERVDDDQARARPAHPRAQRASSTTSTTGARSSTTASCRGTLIVSRSGVRPRRARHPAAGRRLLPRLRLRPRARRRRLLEGARGQRAARRAGISYVLENRVRDDAAAARPVRALPRAPGRPLPGAAAHRAARRSRRPAARRRRRSSSGRRARSTRAYFEHAFLARQMGVELVEASRPRRARRRLLHPHHRRAAARPRDLPADRRRLHGPARVPPGLAARRARPDARLPRGHAWRSSTRSAPASPTTRRSTTTCRR